VHICPIVITSTEATLPLNVMMEEKKLACRG
jgi:hypothetical protein